MARIDRAQVVFTERATSRGFVEACEDGRRSETLRSTYGTCEPTPVFQHVVDCLERMATMAGRPAAGRAAVAATAGSSCTRFVVGESRIAKAVPQGAATRCTQTQAGSMRPGNRVVATLSRRQSRQATWRG